MKYSKHSNFVGLFGEINVKGLADGSVFLQLGGGQFGCLDFHQSSLKVETKRYAVFRLFRSDTIAVINICRIV